ncbi:MAG: peptidylprolyl isomerase [bacterium]
MIINKKQILIISITIFILLILVSVFVYFNFIKRGETEGIIVAEVGSEKLTAEELYNMIEETKRNTPEMFRATITPESVMDQWIEFQILAKEGLRRGYDKDPDMKKKLEEYKKSLVVKKLWDEEIEKKITTATEEELLKYYEKVKKRDYLVKDELMHLRVITVKGEAEAERIREKAMSGEDFGELAKKYSIRLDNKESGGDMGYMKSSELPKKVSDIVFNLDKGDISLPIKIDIGYSIYKVEDKLKPGDFVPYDYVKKQLKDRYIIALKKKTAVDFAEMLKKENQPIKYLSRYTDYLNERYKEERKMKEETSNNK